MITDLQMQDWLPRCESVARPLVGLGNAEFDDLVQEGWIFCWLSLRQGIRPRTEHIRHRMLNWCRYLQKLDRGDPIPYEWAFDEGEDYHDDVHD